MTKRMARSLVVLTLLSLLLVGGHGKLIGSSLNITRVSPTVGNWWFGSFPRESVQLI